MSLAVLLDTIVTKLQTKESGSNVFDFSQDLLIADPDPDTSQVVRAIKVGNPPGRLDGSYGGMRAIRVWGTVSEEAGLELANVHSEVYSVTCTLTYRTVGIPRDEVEDLLTPSGAMYRVARKIVGALRDNALHGQARTDMGLPSESDDLINWFTSWDMGSPSEVGPDWFGEEPSTDDPFTGLSLDVTFSGATRLTCLD